MFFIFKDLYIFCTLICFKHLLTLYVFVYCFIVFKCSLILVYNTKMYYTCYIMTTYFNIVVMPYTVVKASAIIATIKSDTVTCIAVANWQYSTPWVPHCLLVMFAFPNTTLLLLLLLKHSKALDTFTHLEFTFLLMSDRFF